MIWRSLIFPTGDRYSHYGSLNLISSTSLFIKGYRRMAIPDFDMLFKSF